MDTFALIGLIFVAGLLSAAVVFLVVPGLVMFWFLVLKMMGVPKVVALWEKWQLEWEHPRELVLLAKTAARLNQEYEKSRLGLLDLQDGSPEKASAINDLETVKDQMFKTNFSLGLAIIKHLENLGEIK